MLVYFKNSMIALFALHAIFGTSATIAQEPSPDESATMPACTDHLNRAVAYVSTEDYEITPSVFIAGARYLNREDISSPAIFYDPAYTSQMSPIQRDFLMAHECYHFRSGDAYTAYVLLNNNEYLSPEQNKHFEDDADCFAARQLNVRFNYTANDLRDLETLVHRSTPTSKRQARREQIVRCFSSP